MPFRKLTVCVVEDHDFQRKVAVELLNQLGVKDVLQAADGRQALAVIKASPIPVDAVMIDLDLPRMDGIELIAHLAAERIVPAVAVFSALDRGLIDSVHKIARNAGLIVLGAVEKPLTLGKLAAVLGPLMRDLRAPYVTDAAMNRETLALAIAQHQVQPVFQPKVEVQRGVVVGVEALARWNLPDGSVIEPDHFIGAFEREGLGSALTERMLERACQWRGVWAQRGIDLEIAVNLCTDALLSADVVDRLVEVVRREGQDPRSVILEITEAALQTHLTPGMLQTLARLRLKGFGLSIDDFGVARFAVDELAEVPFTELKIDRSLVADDRPDSHACALYDAGVMMARKLGLRIVVEGVETLEQWQRAASRNCHMVQGFLISRPVRGNELIDQVRTWSGPVGRG